MQFDPSNYNDRGSASVAILLGKTLMKKKNAEISSFVKRERGSLIVWKINLKTPQLRDYIDKFRGLESHNVSFPDMNSVLHSSSEKVVCCQASSSGLIPLSSDSIPQISGFLCNFTIGLSSKTKSFAMT